MTVLLATLPAIFLLGGAFLVLVPLPFLSRFRPAIPVATYVLAVLAVIALAQTMRGAVSLLEPSAILPNLSLTVQWDGTALPLCLFLLTLLAAQALLQRTGDNDPFVGGSLVVAGGAVLFLAADNWTTVAAGWLIVEFGLLIVPPDERADQDAASRAFGWNLTALVAWLSAGVVLSNEASSLRLAEAALQGTAALLVFIAAWIRSGLYPFQSAAPTSAAAAGVRLGVPLLLGGYLMSVLLLRMSGEMQARAWMPLLALAALAISALIVVGQPHGPDALVWSMRAFGAPLVVMPFLVTFPLAGAVTLWLALAAYGACALLSIAVQWRAQLPNLPLYTLLWAAELVLVAMLPLTPAFWSRVGLLADSYASGLLPLWIVLTATLTLILIPLWRELFASRDIAPRAPARYESAALGALFLPLVAAALVPFVFTAPFGEVMAAGAEAAYAGIISPVNPATLIFTLAGLVVPLLASFEFARRWTRGANLIPLRLASVLELTGVARSLDLLYRFLRALVQESLAVLEQPPIAWMIFLAIWVAVWLSGL